jgi:predicted RecB family nuclease
MVFCKAEYTQNLFGVFMTPMLSKSKFVAGWQCDKQAFLNAKFPKLATPFDSATLARFAGGTRFGILAQSAWPNGVLIHSPAFKHDAAVAWTKDLIDGDEVDVIFEAGFTALGTRVRADVMIRNCETSKWDLVEVKSSSSAKEVHDVDMAIQRAVLEASGVVVGTTGVMLVDSDYVRDDAEVTPEGLFKIVDRTEEVLALLPSVISLNSHLHEVISSETMPDIKIGPHCEEPYDCQYFDYCSKDRPIDWIQNLPGFGLKKVSELESRGVIGISDIGSTEKLNELQNRAVESTVSKTPWVSDRLSEVLSGVGYPMRFIDFETAAPTVPLFPRTSPREVISFQWSCHTLDSDRSLGHSDYLAGGESDPRREFVESLLRAVGTEGPVLVYSGYEQTTLRGLASLFPDLKSQIDDLIARFVDLLNLLKENYYHPAFRGSFSIKRVLPVMVPGYDYSDLAIGEGETASAAFVDIVEGRVGDDELDDVLYDLLEYCKRDTEAMVRIWQRLESIAAKGKS